MRLQCRPPTRAARPALSASRNPWSNRLIRPFRRNGEPAANSRAVAALSGKVQKAHSQMTTSTEASCIVKRSHKRRIDARAAVRQVRQEQPHQGAARSFGCAHQSVSDHYDRKASAHHGDPEPLPSYSAYVQILHMFRPYLTFACPTRRRPRAFPIPGTLVLEISSERYTVCKSSRRESRF